MLAGLLYFYLKGRRNLPPQCSEWDKSADGPRERENVRTCSRFSKTALQHADNWAPGHGRPRLTGSPSWTPLPLPPHTIPLGHPSAPALSILYHASNLDWQFVSHMILYMFQCHSPKSSHHCPFPQSLKDCSIHLCLLLTPIQGYRYHLSKFHIYVLVYCIGVFLSGYFSLYNRLQFHPPHQNWFKCILFIFLLF